MHLASDRDRRYDGQGSTLSPENVSKMSYQARVDSLRNLALSLLKEQSASEQPSPVIFLNEDQFCLCW
jgi:hypothetical protein